jgi:hypothetical protein
VDDTIGFSRAYNRQGRMAGTYTYIPPAPDRISSGEWRRN